MNKLRLFTVAIILALYSTLTLSGEISNSLRKRLLKEKQISIRMQGCDNNLKFLFDTIDYFPQIITNITPSKNSLYYKIPNYETKIKEIENAIPVITVVAREYKKDHGVYPLMMTMIDEIKAQTDELADLIKNISDHPEVKYYTLKTEKKIRYNPSRINGMMKIIESNKDKIIGVRFNPDNEGQMALLGRFRQQYFGDIGELDILLRFNNILAQGMFFRKSGSYFQEEGHKINDLFVDSLKRKIDMLRNLYKTPKDLVRLEEQMTKKYPYMLYKAKKIKTTESIDIITKIKSWIENKEIDIVTKFNDKIYGLIEVKNFIQIKTKKDSSYRSALKQKMELLNILRFLEVDEKFFPIIVFKRGTTRKVVEAFKKEGIMALGPIIEN